MTATATRIRLPHHFTARDYQRPILATFPEYKKRAAWVVHRRGGKDLTAWSAIVIPEAAETVGIYYYMLPTATQARRVIWMGMDNEGRRFLDRVPRDLIRDTNETRMEIQLINGSIIQLLGSDNYNSIVGANPRGIVISEWSLCNPAAYDYFRPMLRTNGGWALFLYTPRGLNHGADTLDIARANPATWFSEVLTVEDTGVLSPADLDAERAEGMSEDMIRQEYYCDFTAANQGSYFGRLMADAQDAGRITRVPYQPALPVHTSWDLGVGDSTAIWFFQLAGQERHYIDYYEASGEGLPHYAKVLQDRGYVYGQHYGPHDTAARELGTGKSREEVARDLGIRFVIVPAQRLEDQIEAARTILPLSWFDAEKCKPGIATLRAYHKRYDEARKAYSDRPEHDWSSHGASAFMTGAIGYRPAATLPRATARPPAWAQ